MIRVTFSAPDIPVVASEFQKWGDNLPYAMKFTMGQAGAKLLKMVRSMAVAGGSQPDRRTGQYAASIRKESEHIKNESTVWVGTDEPYGWRLEMGGVSSDAMGRTIVTSPHPHFDPAMRSMNEVLMKDLGDLVDRIVK